jgi:hypothetical protein
MIILSDEIIVFSTLDAIVLVWMVLKICLYHWMEAPTPPKKIRSVNGAA